MLDFPVPGVSFPVPSKRPHMKFEPTREQRNVVRFMVAANIPNHIIAALIENPETNKGVSKNTFKRSFKDELANGKEQLEAFLVAKLFKLIQDGDRAALFFMLKTKFGWRETNRGSDYDPEDTAALLPMSPVGGNVIDITPELIPDDPAIASQIYQRMIAG